VNFGRVQAVMLRQLFLLRNSPARVLGLFAWVAIDILIWGYFSRYLQSLGAPQSSFIPAFLGALLLWDFFTRVVQGVSTAFLEEVWSRNFLNLFSTPLTLGEYLLGLILTAIWTSLVGLGAMLVIATAVFSLSWAAYGLALIPFMLTLYLFGLAIGIAASALLLRGGPSVEWLVWMMPAMLCPFGAVFYPVSVLPGWMQAVAWLLPPAYVFEGMRTAAAHATVAPGMLAGGVALALGYLALAIAVFRSVYRRALRTGGVARYSAEE